MLYVSLTHTQNLAGGVDFGNLSVVIPSVEWSALSVHETTNPPKIIRLYLILSYLNGDTLAGIAPLWTAWVVLLCISMPLISQKPCVMYAQLSVSKRKTTNLSGSLS